MKLKLCNCCMEYLPVWNQVATVSNHAKLCVLHVHASQLEGLYISESANRQEWR